MASKRPGLYKEPHGRTTRQATVRSENMTMSTFVHAVFFTCKPSTPPTQIELLAKDCRSMLAQIPSVRLLKAGRREESMTREVNDTAYHVGLVVHFDDMSGYRIYADHPFHMDFIAKHKDHWANVRGVRLHRRLTQNRQPKRPIPYLPLPQGLA